MNENSSWINASAANGNDSWTINESVEVNATLQDVLIEGNDADKQWAKLILDACRFWIPNVLLPLVVAVGVVGNVITVIVMTRKRMKSSTNTYLTALAVSDLLFLIFNMILSLEHKPTIRDIEYLPYWHIHKWTIWLVDAAGACSNWLTVSFTLERYIAVRHPLRGKVLCTESRARKVIAVVILLSCFLTATTAFEWTVDVNDGGKVGLAMTWLGEHPTYRSVFYWFSSITVMAIPLASLSVLNYLLVAAVRRSTKGRNQLTEDARGVRGSFRPTSPSNSIYNRYCSERSPATTGMAQRRVFKERQENKVTIVLISVVFLFLICQAPSGVTVIVKKWSQVLVHSLQIITLLIYVQVFYEPLSGTTGDYLLRSAGNICNFLMVINAASNFFLYCALSDSYQRTLTATFCRRRRYWHDRVDTLSTATSFRNSSMKQIKQEHEQETLSQC